MSARNFFQRPQDVRDPRPLGFFGQFTRSINFVSISGSAQDPQAKDVWTISVHATPDNSTLYSITIDGDTVASYTTDASATQQELSDGLTAAFNATPSARAIAIATNVTATITLTGVWPNVAFVPTVNSADTVNDLGVPSNTVVAAAADSVAFGRVMATDGFVTDEGNPGVFVPQTTHFTAQVITFTYASVDAGDEVTLTVWFAGQKYSESTTFDTSLTVTLAALVTAMDVILDAAFGAGESILLASDATTLTLTSDTPGSEFDATSIVTDTGTVVKAYTTAPGLTTSLLRAMVGFSVRRLDVENATIDGDDPVYAANEAVEVATRANHGVVQRDTTETWAHSDELYVSLAAATKGRLYNSAGTDRVWIGISKVRIQRQEPSTSTDGLGVISLDMGA